MERYFKEKKLRKVFVVGCFASIAYHNLMDAFFVL